MTKYCNHGHLREGNTYTDPRGRHECSVCRSERAIKFRKQKLVDFPEYQVWINMKRRCSDVLDKHYAYYGGRGIKVSKEWLSFDVWLKDMERRPTSEHSIERINVNEGYSPSNCRWATFKEQQNNRTDNRFYTHRGVTQTIAAWAEYSGLKYHTLYYRLSNGWSIEKALIGKREL